MTCKTMSHGVLRRHNCCAQRALQTTVSSHKSSSFRSTGTLQNWLLEASQWAQQLGQQVCFSGPALPDDPQASHEPTGLAVGGMHEWHIWHTLMTASQPH